MFLKIVIVCAAVFSLAFLSLYSPVQAQAAAPPVPHAQTGFEKCLTCHGTATLPASHSGLDQSSCLACHSFSAQTASPSAAPPTSTVSPPAPQASGDAYCLSCHSQSTLSMTLGGQQVSLYIDQAVLAGSVHGGKLLCTDCHTSLTTYPHPRTDFASRRDFSVAQYELCKQCHFENYTKTLDSVHYKVLSEGMTSAPLCTDCHGAHNVSKPDQPRSKISTTCAECHQDISNQYVQSVHGKALVEDNNYDVPVCTDCHPSHKIVDPTTATFRSQSIDLCGKCHGDNKLMQKYGISTNVVASYLQDFHGATVTLMSQQNKDIWPKTAVCTDCHGVHDIKKVSEADASVIKANLVVTCAKCHPGITPNFPGAWLSHYEPSASVAPLVFVTQWFYRIMIPFIIVGLGAHILLDLWRALTNRK